MKPVHRFNFSISHVDAREEAFSPRRVGPRPAAMRGPALAGRPRCAARAPERRPKSPRCRTASWEEPPTN